MTVSKALVLVAVLLFVFAAFNFNPFALQLVPLGLAFWASASLVP